jgi:hypothetical protein
VKELPKGGSPTARTYISSSGAQASRSQPGKAAGPGELHAGACLVRPAQVW